MLWNVSVFMTQNMEHLMIEKSQKSAAKSERSAVMSAINEAGHMLRELCGPRGWNDTRESWLRRGARVTGLSMRRARAIFYNERKLRLGADEYIAIQQAYEAAQRSMETLSTLAREADVRADRLTRT